MSGIDERDGATIGALGSCRPAMHHGNAERSEQQIPALVLQAQKPFMMYVNEKWDQSILPSLRHAPRLKVARYSIPVVTQRRTPANQPIKSLANPSQNVENILSLDFESTGKNWKQPPIFEGPVVYESTATRA